MAPISYFAYLCLYLSNDIKKKYSTCKHETKFICFGLACSLQPLIDEELSAVVMRRQFFISYRKYRGFISSSNTLSTHGSAVAELLIVIE